MNTVSTYAAAPPTTTVVPGSIKSSPNVERRPRGRAAAFTCTPLTVPPWTTAGPNSRPSIHYAAAACARHAARLGYPIRVCKADRLRLSLARASGSRPGAVEVGRTSGRYRIRPAAFSTCDDSVAQLVSAAFVSGSVHGGSIPPDPDPAAVDGTAQVGRNCGAGSSPAGVIVLSSGPAGLSLSRETVRWGLFSLAKRGLIMGDERDDEGRPTSGLVNAECQRQADRRAAKDEEYMNGLYLDWKELQ